MDIQFSPARTPAPPPSSPARRRTRLLGLARGIELGLVLLVLAAAVTGVWAVLRLRADTAPRDLAGFALRELVEGDAALEMVRGLHAGDVQLRAAQVASYEGTATVWVGVAATEVEAQALLEDMVDAIRGAGAPFSPPVETAIDGRPVFATSDRSRRHYIFRSGSRVVWVLPPAGSEVPFMRAALRAF